MDITISSKSYHLGTSGIDSQLKTRKSTTVTFAVCYKGGYEAKMLSKLYYTRELVIMHLCVPYQFLKNYNFSPTWTICISNESSNYSEFILVIKKYNYVFFEKRMNFKMFWFNFQRKKNLNTDYQKKKFTIPKMLFANDFQHQKKNLQKG